MTAGEGAAHGATLSVRRAGKTFPGGVVALAPTDLDLPAGEILVLLGPSGCGKTTLLRLVAGLAAPDPGGAVLFDGIDVTATPIERRRVGMVFQSYALFPNMTVAENVGYGLKVRGEPRAVRDAEVARLLEMVGLEQLADRPVDRISGGQRQRVALARAIAIRPKILLLDEPLSALDAALRERLRIELAALLRRFAITAIHVTHDQAEAMAIGDRIAVMRDGRIVQRDAPEAIYERPADAFVARFVGTMNRLPGRLVPGATAEVVHFRPEAVTLGPAGTDTIPARVTAATFFGAHRRLSLDVAGHVVEADVPASWRVAVGDSVALTIDPARLHVFPDTDPVTTPSPDAC
ncbi:ABC transporter ATP-binding protein [Rhodoplanes elegans]|uniref:ABC transporter ATP-binding protein n=1 Tax=Rhodoplanes elegans TaxID=29408 RepID=A0A327KCX7_9BRAD|nr:ABC transporter ATP-binding protein [Rhodoplanes elegans]MBK5958948.1 ABC transporter ATP-binding protein [Rhodoplanes elegans]RAI36217.1 ABC transporter ATP-binding protein [Rhodoplanes elegans]